MWITVALPGKLGFDGVWYQMEMHLPIGCYFTEIDGWLSDS